jgi:hypothetical protein
VTGEAVFHDCELEEIGIGGRITENRLVRRAGQPQAPDGDAVLGFPVEIAHSADGIGELTKVGPEDAKSLTVQRLFGGAYHGIPQAGLIDDRHQLVGIGNGLILGTGIVMTTEKT